MRRGKQTKIARYVDKFHPWSMSRIYILSQKGSKKARSVRYSDIPPKINMSPKKGPFQSERIILQQSFLRGKLLVFTCFYGVIV